MCTAAELYGLGPGTKEEERLGDGGAKGLSREERCVVRLLAAGNPYPQPKPSVASCG